MLKESLIKLILKLRSDQGKFLRLEKDLKLSIFSKQIQLCAGLGHQSGSCDRKVEHVRGSSLRTENQFPDHLHYV